MVSTTMLMTEWGFYKKVSFQLSQLATLDGDAIVSFKTAAYDGVLIGEQYGLFQRH